MLGAGGTDITADDPTRASQATLGCSWTFLGGPGGDRWVDDPWPLLCREDVIITHAGQNAIAECAAARTPTIVIPQARPPHAEQQATARALQAADLATVRPAWPAPEEWTSLLGRAASRPGDRWAVWAPGDGARRAARLLDQLSATAPEERQAPCASQ